MKESEKLSKIFGGGFFFYWGLIGKLRDDKKMSRCFEFKIRDFFEEEEVLFESEKDYWYR